MLVELNGKKSSNIFLSSPHWWWWWLLSPELLLGLFACLHNEELELEPRFLRMAVCALCWVRHCLAPPCRPLWVPWHVNISQNADHWIQKKKPMQTSEVQGHDLVFFFIRMSIIAVRGRETPGKMLFVEQETKYYGGKTCWWTVKKEITVVK